MIDALLGGADWDAPPAEMEMASTYRALLEDIMRLARTIRAGYGSSGGPAETELQSAALALYVRVPGIVNVMLNGKICIEHGLPLHPTVYYELKEARKYRLEHGLMAVDAANRLYLRSIELARSAYRLDEGFEDAARAYLRDLPPEFLPFIYTGIRDNYTWRASNPDILRRLAAKVAESSFKPDILVAAAHGAIMPALLLSEYLGVPLYFIRLSMFKRFDEEPIVSFSDKARLYDFRERRALIYDEDVAGGRTLALFAEKLAPLFGEAMTACSIRHAGSSIRPDFFGKIWWD